jgi:hypothetical protein
MHGHGTAELSDSAPVDFDDLRDSSYGTDFGMHDPRWTSRFHSDERHVPRYDSLYSDDLS